MAFFWQVKKARRTYIHTDKRTERGQKTAEESIKFGQLHKNDVGDWMYAFILCRTKLHKYIHCDVANFVLAVYTNMPLFHRLLIQKRKVREKKERHPFPFSLFSQPSFWFSRGESWVSRYSYSTTYFPE